MGTVLDALTALAPEERVRVVQWVVNKLAIELGPVRNAGKAQSQGGSDIDGAPITLSTDTIATVINAKSGADLIIAASAHLLFSKGKQTFTRQDITTEMRTAPAHFKETYVNNLSTYLTSLTKADRLRLVGSSTYALSNKEKQTLGAKLADA
jgi:hypothetical protein